MTQFQPTPFARASRMYSESSTSSIDDRVRRIRAAAAPQPSAMHGRTYSFQLNSGDLPPAGNQPNMTAKIQIATRAVTNGGAACPTIASDLAK